MDYSEEQIKSLFEKLPEDVRAAITSVGVANLLHEIGEKYRLHLDKIDELFDETTLVMLGLTHPDKYLSRLKERLEIPEDMARDLAEEINNQIFLPIRESLKKIHDVKEGEDVGIDLRPTAVENPPAAITSEDRKIFAESGIEIGKTTNNNQQITSTGSEEIPGKEKILEAIENPKKAAQEEALLPAGFTTVSRPALPSPKEVVPPDKKLEAPVKMPVSESVYTANGKSAAESTAAPKPQADPYREPVS